MVSIDLSLFVEIVIFLSLLFTLDRIFYRPVLAKISERKQRLVEEKTTLDGIQSNELILKNNIQSKLTGAHQTAEQFHTDTLRKVENITADQISKLSSEYNEKTLAYTQKTEKNIECSRQEITPQIEPLARQFIKKLLPLVICIFLMGFPVFGALAESPGHGADSHDSEHAEEHAGISETWRAINFIVMVSILLLLTRKPISRALLNRSEGIRNTLQESTLAIESASGDLSQLETRLSEVETEASEIVHKSAAQTEELQKQLENDGLAKLEKIKMIGNKQLEMISQKAFESLNTDTVSKALEKAVDILSEGIDLETDRNLVSDCIDKLDVQIRKNKES